MTWWTPERVQLLRDLWASGYRSTEIVALMGARSRNAIEGKAARLKLERCGKPLGARPPKPQRPPSAGSIHDTFGNMPGSIYATRGLKAPAEPVKQFDPGPLTAGDAMAKRRRGLCIVAGCEGTRMKPYDCCLNHKPTRAA